MSLAWPAVLLQQVCKALCSVAYCSRGSVLVLTAVCAPVLFLLVGFSIDYAYASYINHRLANASDSAALTAVSQSAASAVGGYANTAGLQAYGARIFNENVSDLALPNVNFSLNVTQNSNTLLVTASASYTYSVPIFFGGLVGRTTFPLSGSLIAKAQPPTYINYYLLVDVSNSMGIGATQADMTALYAKLKSKGFVQNGETGCVFACHNANAGSLYTYTTESVARDIGITLRIDSAVTAIQSIISSAAAIAGTTRNISFGIYLLQDGSSFTNGVGKLVDPPSANYSNLITLSNTIDLGNNSGTASFGDTDLQKELTAFNGLLPSNGTGASAASPLNYVFLITDGVVDNFTSPLPYCVAACVGPINASWCSGIKSKSTLGVIYTTYLPIWLNNDPTTKTYELLYGSSVFNIPSFSSQISPNLQNCATSSDYFFEASDGPSIVTQMQALFNKTQPLSARLTQ